MTNSTALKIVYNDAMIPDCAIQSLSHSWEKPRLFMHHVQTLINYYSVDTVLGRKATFKELCLVHDAHYVREVLLGYWAGGFGQQGLINNRVLAKSCQYTCGGMLTAVDLVLTTQSDVCVPVSGFHHAHYNSSHGFCTFNGLALAAHILQKKGATVGILDLDMHYGDGTDDIFNEIGNPPIRFTHQDEFDQQLVREQLVNVLENRFKNIDVLLYQAGADAHIDDPLGGYLTTREMRKRDDCVFNFCRENNIRVIWCLAGGYQNPFSKTLDLHKNTLRAFVGDG